jgi:hypothetical protein
MSSDKGSRQQYVCDRCGFYFRKSTLLKQRGLLVCKKCHDSALELKPIDVKWNSPRIVADPLAPASQPIVFTITSAGVTALSNSQTFVNEGRKNTYVMWIKGDGATVVTGNPAIVAGTQGDRISLIGTSNTNTVRFTSGNGISLTGGLGFTIQDKCALQLSYDGTANLWRETSRTMP